MEKTFSKRPSLIDEISQNSDKYNHELTQLFADSDHIYFGEDCTTFRYSRLTKQWIQFENVEWNEFMSHPHCYVPRRWAKDDYVRNYTNPIFIIRTLSVKLRCEFEKKRIRQCVRVIERRVKAVDDKPTMPGGKVIDFRMNVEESDTHGSRVFVVNHRLGYVFLQRCRSRPEDMEFYGKEPLHVFEIFRRESELDKDRNLNQWKSRRIVSNRWKKNNLFFCPDSTQLFLHNRRIYCVNLKDVKKILCLDLGSGKFHFVPYVRPDPLHGLPNSKYFHSSPTIFQSNVYFYNLCKFDTDPDNRRTFTRLWKLSLDEKFQWKYVLQIESSDVTATFFNEDGSIRLFPSLPEYVNPVTNNAYCREDSLQCRLVVPPLEQRATEALIAAFPRLFYKTDFEARLSEPIDLIRAALHLSKHNDWQIFCWWLK